MFTFQSVIILLSHLVYWLKSVCLCLQVSCRCLCRISDRSDNDKKELKNICKHSANCLTNSVGTDSFVLGTITKFIWLFSLVIKILCRRYIDTKWLNESNLCRLWLESVRAWLSCQISCLSGPFSLSSLDTHQAGSDGNCGRMSQINPGWWVINNISLLSGWNMIIFTKCLDVF